MHIYLRVVYRISASQINSSIAVSTPPNMRLSNPKWQSAGSGRVDWNRDDISLLQQYNVFPLSEPHSLVFNSSLGLSFNALHAGSVSGRHRPSCCIVLLHESNIFNFSVKESI